MTDPTLPAETDLLIVGAGPYGLGIAAYAKTLGVDPLVVGRPMAFWREDMPHGMFLRSSWDWQYDPNNVNTIETWLRETGRSKESIDPFPLADYIEFATWFEVVSGVSPVDLAIQRIDLRPDGRYDAVFVDGSIVTAKNVVLALGFAYFDYVPEELQVILPAENVVHTVHYVDFSDAPGQRYAIVGGRQSAYEWAALLHEAGAASVDVIHRHRTPRFVPADWSWTTPVVERIATEPQWFRELDDAQKRKVAFRLWIEGRSKLEPWLAPRIAHRNVRSRPGRTIGGSEVGPGGEIGLTLDNADRLDVDKVVLATGYRTDIQNVPMLAAGNILEHIESANGSPVLDSTFQMSTPGLYATSMMATSEFGPLFAFTVAVRASSRVVADAVRQRR